MSERMHWCLVVTFAAAMAWVEAAVVVYLRILIDRVQPYQPDPLPASVGLGEIEVVREIATLVMIGMVGALAGRTWRRRLGYGMLTFGVWDILYYVFLRPMSGWPASLLDWDILFLLPLPWWGPVLAPMVIAAFMIGIGTLISQGDRPGQPIWPGRPAWMAWLIGALIVLYTFMADAIRAMSGGVEAIRQVLPSEFNWPLYIVGLILLGAPLFDVGYHLAVLWLVQRSTGTAEATRRAV